MEQGIRLLKKFNADAIFVTEDCKLFLTEGLLNNFTMLNDTKPKQHFGGQYENWKV